MTNRIVKELVNYFIDHNIPFSDSEKIAYKLIDLAFPPRTCDYCIKIIKKLRLEKNLGDIYPAMIRLQEIYKDRFE